MNDVVLVISCLKHMRYHCRFIAQFNKKYSKTHRHLQLHIFLIFLGGDTSGHFRLRIGVRVLLGELWEGRREEFPIIVSSFGPPNTVIRRCAYYWCCSTNDHCYVVVIINISIFCSLISLKENNLTRQESLYSNLKSNYRYLNSVVLGMRTIWPLQIIARRRVKQFIVLPAAIDVGVLSDVYLYLRPSVCLGKSAAF